MKKKILVLSGSPRKDGNSDLLCDQVMQGAREANHVAEKIRISDKNIGYCVACDFCQSHDGACTRKDDMAEIIEKMIEADVIVLATPVYFYSICAQMKTMIDRTLAKYTKILDKEFYFIVTAAEDRMEAAVRTVECLRGFTDCLDGSKEKGIIYGIGAWEKGAIKGTEAYRLAYETGKNI